MWWAYIIVLGQSCEFLISLLTALEYLQMGIPSVSGKCREAWTSIVKLDGIVNMHKQHKMSISSNLWIKKIRRDLTTFYRK